MTKKQEDYSEIIEYMNRLSTRVIEIENQSKKVLSNVNQEDTLLKKSVSKLKAEIKSLRTASTTAKEIVKKQKEIINKLVNEFKGMAKQEQLDRLKEKIEAWDPENLLTKNELKKNL